MLASTIRDEYDVEIYDAYKSNHSESEFIDKIKKCKPDVYREFLFCLISMELVVIELLK